MYEPAIIPLLVSVLNFALMPRGGQHDPVAYIALTVRNKDTVAKFILQAGEMLDTISVLFAHRVMKGHPL